MSTETNHQNIEQDNIDFRKIIFRIILKWPYFLVSIILFLLLTYVFIRYTDPLYQLKATVLVRDESNVSMGAENLLEGLELFKGKKNLENEIGLIKSRTLILKTIKHLDFNVSYFTMGDVKKVEYYHKFPFKVELDTNHLQLIRTPIYITPLNKNQFEYSITTEEGKAIFLNHPDDFDDNESNKISIKGKGYFGQTVESMFFSFKVYPTKDTSLHRDKKLFFIINNQERLADQYEKNLLVNPINKKASILELSVQGPVVEKEKAFLNKLAQVYIASGLEEKNQIATNTIQFIDEQLSGITDSLKLAEEDLQSFRSNNNILDINISTKVIIEKLEKLENEKSILNLQFKYYNYLKGYFEANQDIKEIIAPSAMGIEDPLLNSQIHELVKLNNEKSALLISGTEQNPYVNVLQQKIKSVKATLVENLNNIVKTAQLSLNDINSRIKDAEIDVNKLPATERKLVNIQRRFLLNDNIYNYLLEKRAEAGIAKAANTADNRIVDPAKLVSRNPSYPNKPLFYLIALVLGVIIPLGVVLAMDFFNNSIRSREELEQLTSLPIIGMVGHLEDKDKVLITEIPKSPIAESFRSIRTNLQYLSSNLDKKVIGITSSISGEGKTFFSVNLGIIISMTNKKTLLIGTDLRKPTINNYFDLKTDKGLSSYLIGQHSLEQIIQSTHIHNLDIITSGPIPPNPSELLTISKIDELFGLLKTKYDYIIIDSSPIGLVADYYSMIKFVDVNLYIVRLAYTPREIIKKINIAEQKDKLKNLSIVINDFDKQDSYSYSYYGYGNYYQEEKITKENKFKNIISKFSKLS